jgi:hypothetical protein
MLRGERYCGDGNWPISDLSLRSGSQPHPEACPHHGMAASSGRARQYLHRCGDEFLHQRVDGTFGLHDGGR